mgnify:CR=1 FL=1
MRIYEAIEECHLEIPDLTDNIYYELGRLYDDATWIRAAQTLLNGLGRQHTLTGSPLKQLVGITRDYQEFDSITPPQKWLVMHLVIENWHHLGIDARGQLQL